MPCYDPETPSERNEREKREWAAITAPLQEEISVLKEELKESEAMLCAVLASLMSFSIRREVLAHIDEQEAGVTVEQIMAWWDDHQRKDRQRREALELQRQQRRQEILAGLTPEDREILGL